MAVKTVDAGHELLALNDKIHAAMSNLILGKEEIDGVTIIPVNLIKDAIEAGNEAIKIIKKEAPGLEELPKIEIYRDFLVHLLETIPEWKDGKLALWTGDFEKITNNYINWYAKYVHDAAMLLIGATGELKACKVADLLPDEALAVANYCSGVLPKVSQATVIKVAPKKMTIKGKPTFIKYPQVIEHDLGIHKTKVSPKTIDGTVELGIEYRDSAPNFTDSKSRMQGVQERLEAEGFTCEPKYPTVFCHGEMPKGKLGQLATWFSLLRDADNVGMGPDTVGVVKYPTWDLAANLNNQFAGNAWQSGHGKGDWPALQTQWLQQKPFYEKKPIYEDLRQLIILRDKHHQLIEEAYGVEALHALSLVVTNPEGVKKVVENGHKVVELFKKNHWAYHGLDKAIDSLDTAIKAGKTQGLMGLVDGIGHTMHSAMAGILMKEGFYGGCPTDGDVTNINAGNLAYCEGVLKGTSAVLSKSGNQIRHIVSPNDYTSITMDETPDGSYTTTVWLPDPPELAKEVAAVLEGKGFKHVDDTYKGSITTLDDVRELALFFSNLKGVTDAIGTECVVKAVEVAQKSAKDQNQKAVFAFTQEPTMSTDKQWINLCHKQYGILPPGLTEEEKTILTLIGPEKVYAGCRFGEIIPNWGYLNYCEGVRKNPIATVSAHMNPAGQLEHYFHAETDKLAVINIIDKGHGHYEVDLSQIDVRKPEVQTKVIKELEILGFTCPSSTDCHREVTGHQLRTLAAFLSSLHHIYKLEPSCIPAAVDYAMKQVAALPPGKAAHDVMVYPFKEGEWHKEVCSKIKVPPTIPEWLEEAEKVLPPAVPTKAHKVGGCTSFIKKLTKVKESYCEGVLGTWGEEATLFKLEGLLLGTTAHVTTKESTHWVGAGLAAGAQVLFDSHFNTLYITLPHQWVAIKPINEVLITKFHMDHIVGMKPGQYKRGYALYVADDLATFFSLLTNIHTLPESCHEKAVEHAYNAYKAGQKNIYPLTTKQWMAEVCEEVPEEVPPPSLYSQLSMGKQKIVDGKMLELKKAGIGKIEGIKQVRSEFNLALQGLALLWDALIIPPEKEIPKLKMLYSELSKQNQETVKNKMLELIKEGVNKVSGIAAISIDYNIGLEGLPELWDSLVPKEVAVETLADHIYKGVFVPSPDEWLSLSEIESWLEGTALQEWVKSYSHEAIDLLHKTGKIILDPLTGYYKLAVEPIAEVVETLADHIYKGLFLPNPDKWFSYSEISSWQTGILIPGEKYKANIAAAVDSLLSAGKIIFDPGLHEYKLSLIVPEKMTIEELADYIYKGLFVPNPNMWCSLAHIKGWIAKAWADIIAVDVEVAVNILVDAKKIMWQPDYGYKLAPEKVTIEELAETIYNFLFVPSPNVWFTFDYIESWLEETAPGITAIDIELALDELLDAKKIMRDPELGYTLAPAKTYESLPADEKEIIDVAIEMEIEKEVIDAVTAMRVVEKIQLTFGLKTSPGLWDKVVEQLEVAKEKIELKPPPKTYEELPPDEKEIVDVAIAMKIEKEEFIDAATLIKVIEKIQAEFNLQPTYELKTEIDEQIKAYQEVTVKAVALASLLFWKLFGQYPGQVFSIEDIWGWAPPQFTDLAVVEAALLILIKEGKLLVGTDPTGKATYKLHPAYLTYWLQKFYEENAWYFTMAEALEVLKKKLDWEPSQEYLDLAFNQLVSEEKLTEFEFVYASPLWKDKKWYKSLVEEEGAPAIGIEPPEDLKDWMQNFYDESPTYFTMAQALYSLEKLEDWEPSQEYLDLAFSELLAEGKLIQFDLPVAIVEAPVYASTKWKDKEWYKTFLKLYKAPPPEKEPEAELAALIYDDLFKVGPIAYALDTIYSQYTPKYLASAIGAAINILAKEGKISADIDPETGVMVLETPELPKTYESLSPGKKHEIANAIEYLVKEKKFGADAIKHHLKIQFRVEESPVLDNLIAKYMQIFPPEKLKFPADLSEEEKQVIEVYITQACKGADVSKPADVQACMEKVSKEYGIMPVAELTSWVEEVMQEIEVPRVLPPARVTEVAEAINIIKAGKSYAGCHPKEPGTILSELQAVYCEGILTLPWKHEAGFVRAATDEDIAVLKAATILADKQTPLIQHDGDGYRIRLTTPHPTEMKLVFLDAEKEGPHWKKRQQLASQKLESKLGFACSAFHDGFKCERWVTSPISQHDTQQVRITAAFLSSLHDIDSLEPHCIQPAIDYAYKSAILLEKGNKNLYKSMPYPYLKKEWLKKVCS